MKRIAVILFCFLVSSFLFASSQAPDICIVKTINANDTLSLYSYPLQEYLEQNDLMFDELDGCKVENCMRGYQATFTIENDSLQLNSLHECNRSTSFCDKNSLPSLQKIFGEEAAVGNVFVSWLSGNLRAFSGETVPHLNKMIFPKEELFVVKNGEIRKQKSFVNIKSTKNSIGIEQQTPEFILHLIEENLDWSLLPTTSKKWIADIECTIKKNGKTALILRTSADKSTTAIAEKEFLKCLKDIRWHQYSQLGKKIEVSFKLKARVDNGKKIITKKE